MESFKEQNNNFPSYYDLIDLRKRYEGEQQEYLKLCYSYLNFYTGLIISIIGVTIAGIVQIEPGHRRYLVILTGPLVSIFLAGLGYANVKVFFRRFIEAWMTFRNIEEMLEEEYNKISKMVQRQPLLKSKYGGFITHFERAEIEEIIEDAKSKGQSAEEVVIRITKVGDTLFYSRLTFILFTCISLLLAIVIIWTF